MQRLPILCILKLMYTGRKPWVKLFSKSVALYKGTHECMARSERYTFEYYQRLKHRRDAIADAKIQSLSLEDQEILRKLQIEYEVMKAEGFIQVPEQMTSEDWLSVFQEKTEEDRLSTYQSIIAQHKYVNEWKKHDLHVKKEMKDYCKKNGRCAVIEDSFILVDELMLEIRQMTLDIFKDYEGYRVGLDIVFEINLQSYKRKHRIPNSQQMIRNLKQIGELQQILEMNRNQKYPCKFHVTNLKSASGNTKLLKNLKSLQTAFPFLVCHEESVVRIFSANKLVYLHWSSENSLEEYADRITVISNIGDIGMMKDLTKVHNIEHAHLPLNKYIRFLCSKQPYHLSSVQTIGALQDFYVSNDWSESLAINLLLPQSKFFRVKSLTEFVLNKRQEHKQTYRKDIKIQLDV